MNREIRHLLLTKCAIGKERFSKGSNPDRAKMNSYVETGKIPNLSKEVEQIKRPRLNNMFRSYRNENEKQSEKSKKTIQNYENCLRRFMKFVFELEKGTLIGYMKTSDLHLIKSVEETLVRMDASVISRLVNSFVAHCFFSNSSILYIREQIKILKTLLNSYFRGRNDVIVNIRSKEEAIQAFPKEFMKYSKNKETNAVDEIFELLET